MPELTSPAASSIALPITVAPSSANVAAVSGLAGFCEVLLAKVFQPQAKMPTEDGDRQDDAATGNILPEKDKDTDPALAWLFGAPPVLVPVSTPATTASDTVAGSPTTVQLAPDIAPDVLIASGMPGTKPVATDPLGSCDVVDAKARMLAQPLVPQLHQPDAGATPGQLALLQPLPPTDAASGAPLPIKPPFTQSPSVADRSSNALQPTKPPLVRAQPLPDRASSQQSVAAPLPALFALSLVSKRQPSKEDPLSSLTPATASISQTSMAMPVAPTGDAQRQMLDMGRHDWPQKIIDHIEALRDNANANDTSIRLKPEALGRVDIALRSHADGAISVLFTAEQPTTRTMLVDATPQLSAAAEARGIRLSGTSVDLTGQGDQRPQPQNDRAQPITNRLAMPGGDDNQAVEDGRIA